MAAGLVSVVVRSMARPTLARALASVAMQGYPRIEVLVVAACGPAHPAPPTSAGRHAVRFVPSDRRLNRVSSANAGQDAARGQWITFLDDDDELLPDHTARLVGALQDAPHAGFVHSFSAATAGGRVVRNVGQPSATIELFSRNYIQMSSALWARDLVSAGCRFDPVFESHEDWDFVLHCALTTPFVFVPVRTAIWYWEVGNSGAGFGTNQDIDLFGTALGRIRAKYAAQRARLQRVGAEGEAAALRQIAQGDLAGARATLHAVLHESPNDPAALARLADVELRARNLPAAEQWLTLAVQVKPDDAHLVFGLAVVHRAAGRFDTSRKLATAAAQLDPSLPGVAAFLAAG